MRPVAHCLGLLDKQHDVIKVLRNNTNTDSYCWSDINATRIGVVPEHDGDGWFDAGPRTVERHPQIVAASYLHLGGNHDRCFEAKGLLAQLL